MSQFIERDPPRELARYQVGTRGTSRGVATAVSDGINNTRPLHYHYQYQQYHYNTTQHYHYHNITTLPLKGLSFLKKGPEGVLIRGLLRTSYASGDEPSLFINMFSGRVQLKIRQAIRCSQSLSGTLLRQSIRLLITPYIYVLGNPLKVHITRR
ncbi:hypothetical protein TNCV_1792451 [Trichonephila clavipes]|nr:hypothetical protein TNCV_1792451 [Trichonephila clavipes]